MKTYVEITAQHAKAGSVKPLIMHRPDGRNFEIDRVLDVRMAASLRAGGQGDGGMNSMVRWWRVEIALWVCYWNALDQDDRPSIRYCADYSLLISAFWLVALLGWGCPLEQSSSSCREAAGDPVDFYCNIKFTLFLHNIPFYVFFYFFNRIWDKSPESNKL
jgi:hypothetical protein